jgi:NAD(P)-dependent dehydrogenase (short-subunit alcohol dehydrogenase family)
MFKAGRGKIINTASMASLLVPHPQKQAAYNASKAAGENETGRRMMGAD